MSTLPVHPLHLSQPANPRAFVQSLTAEQLVNLSAHVESGPLMEAIADELIVRFQLNEPSPEERLIIETDEQFDKRPIVRMFEIEPGEPDPFDAM